MNESHRERYLARMRRLLDHIDAQIDAPLDVAALCAVAAFSPFHGQRQFSALFGLGLHAFVQRLRLMVALVLIALFGVITTAALVLFAAPVPITISVAMVAFALVVTEHRASDLLHASELARRIRITRSNLDEVTSNLRLVEDSARLGLWQWDGEGRNIRLSERGALLFGRESAGDVEFDELLSALDPEDPPRAQISAASFATGAEGEFSGQFRVQTASGTRRWVAVHGRLVRDSANALVGAHGVIFDVTDHRSNDVVFGIVAGRPQIHSGIEQLHLRQGQFARAGSRTNLHAAQRSTWPSS